MIRRFDDIENRPLLGLRKGPDGRFRSAEELDDIDDLRRAFRAERGGGRVGVLIAAAIGLMIVAMVLTTI